MKKLGFDLIIIGVPASGKDTQARLLEREFALKSVESGDYLRSLARRNTKFGISVRKALSKGLPAPTPVIKEFIKANVKLAPKDRNLLFVGNPRLKPEAEFLHQLLTKHNRDYLVLYITLPVKEIWTRSEHRMRSIDDAKFVSIRIRWARSQVGKTKRYFEKLKKLRLINGNQSIKAVNKDILDAIIKYKQPTSLSGHATGHLS